MSITRTLGSRFYPHGDFRAKVLLALIVHRWFIRTRWLFTAAILILYFTERVINPAFARTSAVALIAFVLAAINIIWTIVGRRMTGDTSDRESPSTDLIARVTWFVNAQMTVDLLMLTLLLRYSGGVENPMLMFYLFHVLIATLLLRPVNALLQGLWALLAFGGLAAGQCSGILGHDAFLPPDPEGVLHANWMVAFAATGVLAVGIIGTLVFTLQISSRLDEQESRLRATVDALERSRDAIQDLQARRSRFMLTAAHQLKSPLAVVQTLTGLIHDGVVPADSIRPTCARIIERCRDAIQQVGELLTLSRIQDAAPRRSEDGADVGAVLHELMGRYEMIAAGKGVELSCDIPTSGALRVGINSANFADCIGNLIDNAIKYTPRGGHATVSATRVGALDEQPARGGPPSGGDFVCVEVSDSGIGIAPNALAAATDPDGEGSVFDAFIRGDNALAAGITGSGLGLAIVREVVEHARGRICVTSHPGEGTTLRVTLPAAGAALGPASDEAGVLDTRFSVVVVTP